jgi:haloalkane dehalogenase
VYRREFVGMTGGAIGAIALAGCTSPAARNSSAKPAAARARDEMNAAMFHASRRFVETPFGRIAYVERGAGPAALFLHGFPLNGFQWRGALDRLSSSRRCIAPDFLGLGFTEVASGQSVAPDAQVEMLIALLDELCVSSVDLIANDSGGAVAQLFVARYPSRVRTLLLTNCDVENDSPPAAILPVIELARVGKFADEWLAPWLADKALARSAEGLGAMCYTYPANLTDEAIEYYLSPLLRSRESKARLHAYASALEPNPLAGIEATLKRCMAPTRIVWGTGDEIFSPKSPNYLHRTFPNSRGVRTVDGAKLFYVEEFPDLIAEEARRLWGLIGGRSAQE